MKTQAILTLASLCLAVTLGHSGDMKLYGQDGQQSRPAAAETAVEFHRSRPITLKSPSTPTLAALQLDTEIWSHTRVGVPDMRLLDDANRQVPFLVNTLEQPSQQLVRRTWNAEISQLTPRPDGGLGILVKLPDSDPLPAGLQLITPLTNFELRLRIHAGENTDAPVLVEDALLYDYAQFMNARRTEVPLPGNTSRTFYIVADQTVRNSESRLQELTRTFSKGEEIQRTETVLEERRPLRIDQLQFWTEIPDPVSYEQVLQAWQTKSLRIEEDPKNRQTLVYFSADSRPLTQVTLNTTSRNFSRMVHAECLQGGVPEHWQTYASNELRLLDISGVRESLLTLLIPMQRRLQWRLRIENGDSPPLAITSLELAGPISEIVWLAEPGRTYRLLYDDEYASTPQHDVLALKTALASNAEKITAVAGTPEIRTVTIPATAQAQDLLNNPILLFIIAILCTAVMAWGLYRAFERIKTLG
jgi:hypothetical protein